MITSLKGPEAERLCSAIADAYDHESLQQMLLFKLDKHLDWISPADSMPNVAFKVYRTAEREGWVVDLISEGHKFVPGNPSLKALYDEWIVPPAVPLPAQTALSANHFGVCVMRGKRPFVARPRLRNGLSILADNGVLNERLLVVFGDHSTGRSYSQELINYLSEATKKFKTVFVDFTKDAVGEYLPGDLARSILARMGVPAAELPAADALARDLHSSILNALRQREIQDWWFVFDAIDHSTLTRPILDLIHDIALLTQGQASNLRVVLLAYPDREMLPPELSGLYLWDQTTHLSRAEVREFFQALLTLHNQPVSEQRLDAIVDNVFTRVTAGQAHYNAALNNAIREMIIALFV